MVMVAVVVVVVVVVGRVGVVVVGMTVSVEEMEAAAAETAVVVTAAEAAAVSAMSETVCKTGLGSMAWASLSLPLAGSSLTGGNAAVSDSVERAVAGKRTGEPSEAAADDVAEDEGEGTVSEELSA